MAEPTIRFDDGAAYEQMMGIWSRKVGEVFLDWLAPRPGLRWIDVGCGNGAFTELIIARCAPAEVQGIDPSEGQLAFARTRPGLGQAEFTKGDAMALPFAVNRFEAAIMALVLVFVPDPRQGVEEMVRVVAPGGLCATYMWDMLGGGLPLDPMIGEMHEMGLTPPRPPRMEASGLQAMQELWTGAGMQDVQTREIAVRRSFADFDELWRSLLMAASLAPVVAAMTAKDVETLKGRLRRRLPADPDGRITYGARANAVKGRVPH